MSWAKLDDQFFSHPKVIDLSKDAKLLFLAGLTYCAGQLTDGLITPGALRMIAAQVDVERTVSAQLVAGGMWEEVAAGFLVHDYLTYNPSAETVRNERSQTAARVAAFRMRKAAQPTKPPRSGGGNLSNGHGNGVTSTVTNGVGTASPSPYPLTLTPTQEQHPDADAQHARTRARDARVAAAATTGDATLTPPAPAAAADRVNHDTGDAGDASDSAGQAVDAEARDLLARWKPLAKAQRARVPSPSALRDILRKHLARGMTSGDLHGEILKLEDEAAAASESAQTTHPLTLARLDNWLAQWHAPAPESATSQPSRNGAGGVRRAAAAAYAPAVTAIPAIRPDQTRQWWQAPDSAPDPAPDVTPAPHSPSHNTPVAAVAAVADEASSPTPRDEHRAPLTTRDPPALYALPSTG